MERIICLVIGYVFGLFQTAFIYGKAHGIDIRQHGSGNSGTTNALRVLGKKAGLIVFLGDVLKTVLAMVICRLLFQNSAPQMLPLLSLYAGTGVILGHNFPFYMKFKGGKGIAATAGLVTAFDWRFMLVALVLFCMAFFLTNYVSLGSLLVYAGFMVELVVFGQLGKFQMSRNLVYELYVLGAFLTIMAYVKHRENIKRLLKGEERKTYLHKKNKEEINSEKDA
ncbi:MAG: glycerol-3-phosphate 1-O-acyltransferase PlsY [Lachnospiraceae bacterium]|nr:glycerol-3-phosphate 1-O-acyltransferase PlsY [Lachnospiraceae bacterium]